MKYRQKDIFLNSFIEKFDNYKIRTVRQADDHNILPTVRETVFENHAKQRRHRLKYLKKKHRFAGQNINCPNGIHPEL